MPGRYPYTILIRFHSAMLMYINESLEDAEEVSRKDRENKCIQVPPKSTPLLPTAKMAFIHFLSLLAYILVNSCLCYHSSEEVVKMHMFTI